MTETTKSETKKDMKPQKSKGPLRLEALIPIAIVSAGTWAYAAFMLDGHVRKGLEFALSKGYGAQVDIAGVDINFREPSLTFERIQLTDKEKPSLNALEIGKIRFALLWDALLRAKIVINESSITGISLYSPRKTPGEVFPPPPPEPQKGPGITDKIADDLKAEAEAQLKNNGFADVAKILGGADVNDQLQQFRDQLKSEAKIKDLQTTLASKKDQWAKRINELPKPDEMKNLVDRVKSAKINTSNPMEAKNQLEALKNDLTRAQAIVATYQKSQKDIQTDVGGFNDSLKEIDEAAKEDLALLQTKFQLPNIDKESLTKALISRVMGDKLQKLMGFVSKAKAYLPDKTKHGPEKPEFVPHPRGKGRTYKFPVTVGYPLFWLKLAEISSKSTPEGFSGDFSGKLLNVTTDSALINKPTVFDLAGSAPRQEIRDLDLKLVMDYRGDEGVTTMDLLIGAHPFPEQSFVKSEDVTLGVNQSLASLKTRAAFQGGEIKATIVENIANPIFKMDAKAPLLKEALISATDRIKNLGMTVTLSGSFLSPKLGFDSNLGTELAAGLQAHLKAKIDGAKAKLKSFVDDRIHGERQKLMAEYVKAQSAFDGILKGKDAEFKNLQTELEKAYKEKSSNESKKMQDDLKKKGANFLKALKR